jgi:hypothetical protein
MLIPDRTACDVKLCSVELDARLSSCGGSSIPAVMSEME